MYANKILFVRLIVEFTLTDMLQVYFTKCRLSLNILVLNFAVQSLMKWKHFRRYRHGLDFLRSSLSKIFTQNIKGYINILKTDMAPLWTRERLRSVWQRLQTVINQFMNICWTGLILTHWHIQGSHIKESNYKNSCAINYVYICQCVYMCLIDVPLLKMQY